jgi:hypothetical protein
LIGGESVLVNLVWNAFTGQLFCGGRKFEMQVRFARVTRTSNLRKALTAFYSIPRVYKEAASVQMHVVCKLSIA